MRIFRRIIQTIFNLTFQPIVKKYLSKPRKYKYKDLNLIINPSVFHPGFFFSTQFLLSYIQRIDLAGKSFLELGAGNGLISFIANQMKAKVTASDISKNVVDSLLENQKLNKHYFEVIQSDLFSNIKNRKFDVISINPPYYKKQPLNEADFAWYCGTKMEYFEKLFVELRSNIYNHSQILMVLSEDCNIDEIKMIANKNNFELIPKKSKRIWLEMNYIFEIKSISN